MRIETADQIPDGLLPDPHTEGLLDQVERKDGLLLYFPIEQLDRAESGWVVAGPSKHADLTDWNRDDLFLVCWGGVTRWIQVQLIDCSFRNVEKTDGNPGELLLLLCCGAIRCTKIGMIR